MKRKLLVVLLALACTLCCALGLTACDILEKLTCNHSWDDGVEISQPTCTKCGMTKTQALNTTEHNYENYVCTACGGIDPTAPISEGLEFTLSEDGTNYSVTGIGTCTDKDVVIPSTYDGKPVTSIDDRAFAYCTSLTSIAIPRQHHLYR